MFPEEAARTGKRRASTRISRSLVEEEQRSAAANDKKVLHAFVLKVGEKRTSGAVQDAYPGFLSHILESAVATISIETVGEASRLANVKIVASIAVEVAAANPLFP